LRTVIHDDGVRDSKAVDDVEEKFHGLLGSDRCNRPSLNLLHELVNSDKQMRVALGGSLEGPNQIEPPHHKWPRDGDRLSACAGRWVCRA
jgi:hypothetical protein